MYETVCIKKSFPKQTVIDVAVEAQAKGVIVETSEYSCKFTLSNCAVTVNFKEI